MGRDTTQSFVPSDPQPTNLPVVCCEQLNFDKCPNVYVNRATRFVLPVVALPGGGDDLVYPAGERAGQPMRDAKDGEDVARGLVIYNGADGSYQGVRIGETVLINNISDEEGRLILERIASLGKPLTAFTREDYQAVLDFCVSRLHLTDFYYKKPAKVQTEMVRLPEGQILAVPGQGEFPYGPWRVSKDVEHKVVFIPHPFIYKEGPIDAQTYDKPAVIVTDGKYAWGVNGDAFVKSFRRKDGEQEVAIGSLQDEFGG